MKTALSVALLTILGINTSVAAVPYDLSWPIAGKSVKDVYLFYAKEDSVAKTSAKDGMPACSTNNNGRKYPLHLGIDIDTAKDSKVYPVYAKDTKVARVGSFGYPWGDYVVLSHDNNSWTSLYGHITRDPAIKVGTTISSTSLLGKVIDMSQTTNDINHLHLGIRDRKYDLNEQYPAKSGLNPATRGYGHTTCSELMDEWTNIGIVNPLDYLKKNQFVFVDDADNRVVISGNWKDSQNVDLYIGKGYKALTNAKTSDYASYTVNVPADGNYKIYAFWTPSSDRTKKAEFFIAQTRLIRGTSIDLPLKLYVNKDQSDLSNRGKWVELTSQYLVQGAMGISVTNKGDASKSLIIDGLLLEKQ